MTETRKQIIELISDYMNKTLSEWCLVEYINDNKENRFIKTTINNYQSYHLLTKSWKIYSEDNYKWYRYYHKEWKDYKILWHYDITAVLKYIVEKRYSFDNDYHNIRIFNIWDYWEENNTWWIKFKPLYLYTEQEEKKLLKLLLKLK